MKNQNQNIEFNQLLSETENFIYDVLKKKYLKNNEKTLNDIFTMRIIPFLETIEPNKNYINEIRNCFLNRYIIPGGSILSSIGSTRNVSFSNCYATAIEEDSLEGIFTAIQDTALTLASRGGSGTDITILRPKGSPVNNAAIESTGAVSFMPMFSNLCVLIGQKGRNGAAIITLDIRHPDTIDFINCKTHPELVFKHDELTNYYPDISHANISLKITDGFMKAIKEDKDWTFIFPDITFEKYDEEWDGEFDKWLAKGYPVKEYGTIKARKLLMMIAESSWGSGDPGVTYIDNVKNYSTGLFDSKLTPTHLNPCGELTLAKFNNCLLSALILPSFVKNPYTEDAIFDIDSFLDAAKCNVIFLDNLIDYNNHPLQKQIEADRYSRRVGCEITGLADMLAMLNMRYGSEESLIFLDDILYSKAMEELKTSIRLAREKGPAPCLKTKKSRKLYIKQPYIQRLLNNTLKGNKHKVINDIMKYGIRNSAFNTVGPTGTLSIIAGNISSGIEPVFALEYYRKTRSLDKKEYRLIHYPLAKHVGPDILKMDKETIKKKYHYVESHEINYLDRIKVQSTVQKWIDASISSTINLPNDITIEKIYDIYLKAYEHKLKGVTIYRDGCKTGILSTSQDQNTEILSPEQIKKHLEGIKQNISRNCKAYRYIRNWEKIKIYITVTVDKKGKPIEIFANLPHLQDHDKFIEMKSYWDSICRLTSLLLRLNTPIPEIIKQLEKSSISMVELSSIIASILKGFVNVELISNNDDNSNTSLNICPDCGNNSLIFSGGCNYCQQCGYSTCS